ncbi:LptF/LptG family permease [Aureimonas altamirensis]|uniref:LptF/LptG family permease n=1 Tax=Aureimonas altamirensis TaxID=370622 RepID=UPI001E56430D|nr:LptF/LptG family permease [Aureimonas altamirensis]UHD44441.1 LptF/LptG family permease [Aureimonas altamirensis]
MKLLERYILRRAAVFSAASLAALVLVVWVVQVLQRVDLVRSTLGAVGDILWIALMLLPDLTAGVLPFAVLIGSIQALNGLNTDSERSVISAAGASQFLVAKPIILLGLVAAALVLFNSNILGPASSKAFQNGVRSINANAISLFLTPGRFERVQDGVVISVADMRGPVIQGLFLADSRDPATDVNYFAQEASIVDLDGESFLVLKNGQLHRKPVNDDAISVIEFQTYAFDLADLRPVSTRDWIRMSERSTGELTNPDPSDPLYQANPNRFIEELALRWSDWLYPIAFALWAAAVAGPPRTNRQGTGPTMVIGLGGALILKALGFVSLSLVEANTALVPLVFALPLVSAISSAILLARNVNVVESRFVSSISEAISGFAAALRRRSFGGARHTGRTA